MTKDSKQENSNIGNKTKETQLAQHTRSDLPYCSPEIWTIIFSFVGIPGSGNFRKVCYVFNEIGKTYINNIMKAQGLTTKLLDFHPNNLHSAFAGIVRITPRYYSSNIVQNIINKKNPGQTILIKKSGLELNSEEFNTFIEKNQDNENLRVDARSSENICRIM